MDERRNKIIFLTINAKRTLYGVTCDKYSAIQPNITMSLLGAYCKSKGIKVEMLDETRNFSIPEYCEYIRKEKPMLVGIIVSGANPSSSTMSMTGVIKFFEEYNKNPCKETQIFVHGGHPSVLPERTLEETNADFIIIGEGYEAITKLYDHFSNKGLTKRNFELFKIKGLFYESDNIFHNTGFSPLVDVNSLPMIDWSKTNPNKYRAHNWHTFGDLSNRSPYGVIWTTFGCPHNCSFCCINNIFGKRNYRMRDINKVIEEIDTLVLKYNVKHIKILDELFIIKHPRINQFCEALEARDYDLNMWAYGRTDSLDPKLLKRLKGVGLNWMSCGFESIDQKVLDSVNKGYSQKYDEVISMIKDSGISICADFIAGLWEDNYDTMQATYDFACKHNFEWLNIYPCFAYPGTPMYKELLKKRRIKEPKDWSEYALYGYNCNPLPTKYLTAKEVLAWRDEKFVAYHSRWEYIEMITQKFGSDTIKHILKMIYNPLKRKILE